MRVYVNMCACMCVCPYIYRIPVYFVKYSVHCAEHVFVLRDQSSTLTNGNMSEFEFHNV